VFNISAVGSGFGPSAKRRAGEPTVVKNPDDNPFKPRRRTNDWLDELDIGVDTILDRGWQEAKRIEGQENQRYSASVDTLRQGASQFDKPSMTDRDIRRQFSGMADKSARDFRANFSDLRAGLGASGVGPGSGYASSLARGYAAKRAGSITDATMSLYDKRVEADQWDKMARWGASQAVASGIAQDPSAIALDWLGAAGTLELGRGGIHGAKYGAKKAGEAAEQAGMMSALGSGFGGLISALPVIF
jgi:hypothetical protein